jgi:NADH dehydrogenase/NADH:ubiquinone oxidoreductase subunit G
MTQYVTVNIDGALIQAPRGTSVLDAALGAGICIPHLCRVPYLPDLGACRLCIVEHIVKGWPKVTASCTLLVQEGMKVLTNTEKIRKMRRNIAELLVTQAPNSRAIQDIALRCGVASVRYPFRNSDCVLCGRCVTSCTGRFGEKALGFVGRGKHRRVESPFNLHAELCNHCGRCLDLCPMAFTPCEGPMHIGQERLCGNCESKMFTEEARQGYCYGCYMGEGIQCERSMA